jgi:2-polyprenyl-3-methyl-5-hydroxy-6-metoxy-1,4-benzoquinol methylase
MSITLDHGDGSVLVEELSDGRRRISVTPREEGQFIHEHEWTTAYPLDLIRLILNVNGAAGLCFEIMRDEDPSFIQRLLENDLFAYFEPADFRRKRILDFGCGRGASTMILARLFPESEITGVELNSAYVELARKRAEFFKLDKVTFQQSPSGRQLPGNLGEYDFVILSAVFEHLFPEERKVIMQQLWSALTDGGYLFLNQTPNLLFPVELHTTMLPFINYLPDRLAMRAAQRFSRRISANETWPQLLRKGIRGATESEILEILKSADPNARPVMLEPRNHGLRDRIDLYYSNTNMSRLRRIKQISRFAIKTIRAISGLTIVPDLSLAFQKMPARPQSS